MYFLKKGALLLIFGITSLFHCISVPLTSQPLSIPEEKMVIGTQLGGKDKILIIPIEGEISDQSSPGGVFSFDKESIVSKVKTQLILAGQDPDIKAVIFKVDSPGGTVTASDILYHEITEFKKKKNIPILSLFMDVAASGAYYISMASDHIMAHPTTTTGSIGVIMFNINAKEALDKIGIKSMTIRSGQNKATGNPFEEFTPEQKKIYQDLVLDNYERFFSIVKKGRPNIKETELRKLADGRIFSAAQALQNGLIDSIGYFEDSISAVTKIPGYRASAPGAVPKIVFYSYKRKIIENFYQIENNSQIPSSLIENLIPLKNSRDYRLHYLLSP